MKKIVLFLHGYGSNGNDLISLKDYISLEKEDTAVSYKHIRAHET